jgi:hypothetical protein
MLGNRLEDNLAENVIRSQSCMWEITLTANGDHNHGGKERLNVATQGRNGRENVERDLFMIRTNFETTPEG